MFSLILKKKPVAPVKTVFEQECEQLFSLARKDGQNAMAITLLPVADCEGWDYNITFSQMTAPTLKRQLEKNGHTVACVFSTHIDLTAQWPDTPINHPRDFPPQRPAPALRVL